MNSLERLAELFERFPGIGPRQAGRFVHFLLGSSGAYRTSLAGAIQKLGAEVVQCKHCYRWFAKDQGSTLKSPGIKVEPLCSICADPGRDASLLFVVEKDADLEPVEQSGYKGLYFVLGGAVPLAAEEPERHVRARELVARVEQDAGARKLKEVILGLAATAEGDHTRQILEEKLRPLAKPLGLTISALGRGLSTGSELEYADPDTIAQALGNRH